MRPRMTRRAKDTERRWFNKDGFIASMMTTDLTEIDFTCPRCRGADPPIGANAGLSMTAARAASTVALGRFRRARLPTKRAS
jgi:hypothetical protein